MIVSLTSGVHIKIGLHAKHTILHHAKANHLSERLKAFWGPKVAFVIQDIRIYHSHTPTRAHRVPSLSADVGRQLVGQQEASDRILETCSRPAPINRVFSIKRALLRNDSRS